MIQEYKDIWVAALRSGEWPQGKQYLNSNKKYCCLGVFCELLKEEANLTVTNFSRNVISYNGNDAMPPSEIAELVGIDELGKGWAIWVDEHRYELTMLNDSGMPFNQIADLIERFM